MLSEHHIIQDDSTDFSGCLAIIFIYYKKIIYKWMNETKKVKLLHELNYFRCLTAVKTMYPPPPKNKNIYIYTVCLLWVEGLFALFAFLLPHTLTDDEVGHVGSGLSPSCRGLAADGP